MRITLCLPYLNTPRLVYFFNYMFLILGMPDRSILTQKFDLKNNHQKSTDKIRESEKSYLI